MLFHRGTRAPPANLYEALIAMPLDRFQPGRAPSIPVGMAIALVMAEDLIPREG
jgi:hypothetical protein